MSEPTHVSLSTLAAWAGVVVTIIGLIGTLLISSIQREQDALAAELDELARDVHDHMRDGHPVFNKERLERMRDEFDRRLEIIEREIRRQARASQGYQPHDNYD